jgi:hypothetical protein
VSDSEEDIAIDPAVLAFGRKIPITPGQKLQIFFVSPSRYEAV